MGAGAATAKTTQQNDIPSVNVSSIMGPPGPQGPMGPAGEIGAQGPIG